MANKVVYVDSGAAGANNGTSWVNAYTSLVTAIATESTTGIDFYTKSTHTESGATITLTFKGAAATPDRVFSTGTTNSPPTTADLTAGATFSTTTTGTLAINGFVYIYGCTFSPGSGSSAANLSLSSAGTSCDITFDTCKYINTGTGAGTIQFGTAGAAIGQRYTWSNSTFKFAGTGQSLLPVNGTVRIINGSVDGTGSLPTTFLNPGAASRQVNVLVEGHDVSALSAKTLVGAPTYNGAVQFVNCRLPASVTLSGTPTSPGAATVDFIGCDSAATTYKQSRFSYQGSLSPSTTVYNSATDGDTPISWDIVTTANCSPQSPFECFEIDQWVAAGTYANSKIFLTSSATLITTDVWVDCQFLGNGSWPLSKGATTIGAGSGTTLLPQIPQGTTPGGLTASSPAWGHGGLGHDYMLAIPSFTTSIDGYMRFIVKVGKASITTGNLSIDPAVTVAA